MQFKDLGNAVLTIAPTIAGIFGGPLAATGVQALSNAIFGHPNGSAEDVQKAIVQGLSPDQIVAIKQADDVLKQKLIDGGIQIEQIAAQDRASARQLSIQTRDRTPQVIAVLVLIGWAYVQWFLLNHVLDSTMRELIARVLGTLDGALMLVLSFYFGSSSSSSEKNGLISRALEK